MADKVTDDTVADEDDEDGDWSVENETAGGLSADPPGSHLWATLLTPSPTDVDDTEVDDANEDDDPNSWGA